MKEFFIDPYDMQGLFALPASMAAPRPYRGFEYLFFFYLLPWEIVGDTRLRDMPRNPLRAMEDDNWRRIYTSDYFKEVISRGWGFLLWPHLGIPGRMDDYAAESFFYSLATSYANWFAVLGSLGYHPRALAQAKESGQFIFCPLDDVIGLAGRMVEAFKRESRFEEWRDVYLQNPDFDDFERKITENGVKLFILCSPHNPVGRVWTKDELLRMGEICTRHSVRIVSDEIHQDFVYRGHRHHIFADLNPDLSDITVTCTAPSKTFNLAGLQISNIFIANCEMRRAFQREYAAAGLSQLGIMGLVACKSAYEGGGGWLEELKDYLARNLDYLRSFLADDLPQIKLIEPEGTYLVWLDFRGLGIPAKELNDFVVHKAGLWLDDGAMFGASGAGFQRINIACPRKILKQALERLKSAVAML